MTEARLPLAELLAKAGDGDFRRSVAEAVVQLLMETDVDGLIVPGGTSGRPSARPTATAIAIGRWIPGLGAGNHASPNCGRAATSRPSWSPARHPKKP
jgi:hypothetical protein